MTEFEVKELLQFSRFLCMFLNRNIRIEVKDAKDYVRLLEEAEQLRDWAYSKVMKG